MRHAVTILLALALVSTAGAEPKLELIAWAPGYPGTTEQAQPSMDAFTGVVAAAAGWDALGGTYYPGIDEGRERIASDGAAVVLITLPAYLEYGRALGLRPLVRVIQQGVEEDSWSLVAHKGALTGPADLSGWSIEGVSGYSESFVRRVLAGWGALPDDVEVRFNARVLSVLRKAAKGEPVAALLDAAQAEALGRLPFAADLEVVAVSDAMVSSLVCEVGDRLDEGSEQALVNALTGLDGTAAGDEALAEIQVLRFEALDEPTLSVVQSMRGDAAD